MCLHPLTAAERQGALLAQSGRFRPNETFAPPTGTSDVERYTATRRSTNRMGYCRMSIRGLLYIGTAIVIFAVGVAAQVSAKERIVLTLGRGPIAGFRTALFIANVDGTGERQLLSISQFDYSPSFSRDGTWVVFTSERNGSSDIYRVHPDGLGLERLTDDPSFDDQAALSPDNRQLAFVSTRAKGTADIWILGLDSGKLRNLTQGSGGNFRPSWSPDGQWIAFSSDRNSKHRRRSASRFEQVQEASIYVVRADGRELRQLTPSDVYAGSPAWSMNGKKVSFYEMTVDHAFDARLFVIPPGTESQIVAVDVATGARNDLTAGPGVKVAPQYRGDEVAYLIKTGEHAGLAFTKSGFGAAGSMRNPAWSPDGRSVVYQKVTAEPFVQNQPLFSKNAEFELAWSNPFPAFSGNGKLVATTGFTSALGPASLSVMDADGSNARRIFSDGSGAALGAGWSPDGKWIAFGFGTFFQHQAKPARIMMMRDDGSEMRILMQGPNNSGFPSFSPDGRRIVFRLWGDKEQGLRILTIGDGAIETLTTEPDNFPHWSSTADVIEFTRPVAGGYDIFSVRGDGTMLEQLTTAPGNDAHAVWSPDGKFLLFGSGRLGFEDESPLYDAAPQPYAELFIMNADGSNQRPLTDNKWEDGTPAWQPALAAK